MQREIFPCNGRAYRAKLDYRLRGMAILFNKVLAGVRFGGGDVEEYKHRNVWRPCINLSYDVHEL